MQTISHYRIVSKLGAGGMGEVYLAEDTKLDRKVAIKFLPPESTADEPAKKRLVREAKAAAKLDHPNVCSIFEVGEEDGRSFIVMQYIEGVTLASKLQRKPLEILEALDIAAHVADALAEAHSRGIIHRDIKPQNIMLTARGQVKVLDFGLAKVVQPRSFSDSVAETESLLTEPGMIIGTVPYMSPEQVRGETLDARSDIFSFGAVLYEMLSGRQPFSAESLAGTISAILTTEPPRLARYVDTPEELQRIAHKCLEKDRGRRYQTTRDLAIDLENSRRECEARQTSKSDDKQKAESGAAAAPGHPVRRHKVSQQVAARLRLKLSPAEQGRLSKRYTSNPEAYNYYTKAMYHFGNIGPDLNTRPESDLAVDLFKKAIGLDAKYALAHAQLGYVYAEIAVFQEDSPALIEQAKQELGIAERLDPQLAEVHAARYFIAFSQYEGWQVETAIRELRLAQQLDPNVGHAQLSDLYSHIGLEKQADVEREIALKLDPNNEQIRRDYVNQYVLYARPDEGLEARKRVFNRGPDLRYYLEKRMVKEAAPLIEQAYQNEPGTGRAHQERGLWLALQGKHQQAQAAVPSIVEHARRNRGYHHLTYEIARIYALGGNSEEALKWLRLTVREGFPCYPLFARDSFLDPIRKDLAFLQFMTEMKARWEGYRREFGGGPIQ